MKTMGIPYFKKIAFYSVLLTLLTLAGCVKNENLYEPDNTENLPVFDFLTKSTYTLNVKYNVPENYKVYFEVYSESPLAVNEKGETVKRQDLKPIDKGYTDSKGEYSNPLIMRSALNKVYVYTPDAGVPRLLVAEVEGNTLKPAALPREDAATSNTEARSLPGNSLINNVDFTVQTNLLGKWFHTGTISIPNADLMFGEAKVWGRPDYLSYVRQESFPGEGSPALSIPAGVYNLINKVLPGDGMGKVDNAYLKSGDIHVTKDAEVNLYFLDEQCWYMNTLAYYCYETGNPPASAADIKAQTIVFPNAKFLKSHGNPYTTPSGIYTGAWDYGALLPGEGVKLHYVDKSGVDQGTTFPAGTSIGWILYSNGYDVIGYDHKVSKGLDAIYSDKNLMKGIPHVALFRQGDFAVTSFEDSRRSSIDETNFDYKDLVFHVASTPVDAITPEIPEVPGEDGDKETEVTIQGILTFEDMWPAQGDFDMNDVVVKYVSTVKYNSSNEVLKTMDNYTILWSGATTNNSFAFQNDNLGAGVKNLTITGGDGNWSIDKANNIIRLANDVLGYANKKEKLTFTVVTDFSNPIRKADFKSAPYNPFIIMSGNYEREVHLTNAYPTKFANMELFGTSNDKSKPDKNIFYITYNKDQVQMPFAIDIAFDNEEKLDGFVIPLEKHQIDTHYPTFLKWVTSGGKECSDWYLNPKK